MFANDGSSTLPEQEVSHTLTDSLESPGQALHFPHLFQGLRWFSLKTSSRCWRKCNWRSTCGTARRSRAGRSRERKGGRDVSFDDLAEVLKSRIAVCKNSWRIHQNTFYWCSLKLAQKKRIAVLSNTIPRHRSFQNTSRDLFLRMW